MAVNSFQILLVDVTFYLYHISNVVLYVLIKIRAWIYANKWLKGEYSQQSSSSEPLAHSVLPSHTLVEAMHCTLPRHWKRCGPQSDPEKEQKYIAGLLQIFFPYFFSFIFFVQLKKEVNLEIITKNICIYEKILKLLFEVNDVHWLIDRKAYHNQMDMASDHAVIYQGWNT